MTRAELESKLVDYVFGEVSEAERAELDSALAADAGLREALAVLRDTAGLVAAAKSGAAERLAPERRAAIMAAAEGREAATVSAATAGSEVVKSAPVARSRRWWGQVSQLAAAALLAAASTAAIMSFGRTLRGQEARNSPRPATDHFTVSPTQTPGGPVAGTFQDGSALDKRPRTVSGVERHIGTMLNPSNSAWAASVGTRNRLALETAGKTSVRDYDVQIAQNAAIAEPSAVDLLESIRGEDYARIFDNPWLRPVAEPLSTFSIDVDTAAYSNVRRFVTHGQLPPPDAVRIEEMVNYFAYAYPQPAEGKPFAVRMDVHQAPWEAKHWLLRVAMKAREVKLENAPPSNLVFLVDVSGSMNQENKLPLVKKSLNLLVNELRATDWVSMAVYAGNAGLVLSPTNGEKKTEIRAAIEKLEAGGSTNGGEGIQLAYKVAEENFVKDGINRVVLCTDGDFNVGVSSDGELETLIEKKRTSGVFLSVLGFGVGNYQDKKMQTLADKGNGNAAYIDTIREAKKVLVEQATGTLLTIAKDVKLQLEFNPVRVSSYRLIGYENRLLAAQDFNDDTKDAGEIGAGHCVTALYELVPAGQVALGVEVDALKYQKEPQLPAEVADELLTLKVRYKRPDGDVSEKLEFVARDPGPNPEESSDDFEFAAAVAAFGMSLRQSPYRGSCSFALAEELAAGAAGDDPLRLEFVRMIKEARRIEVKR